MDEVVQNHRDVEGILTVESGLSRRDFAVFMKPEVKDMSNNQSVGYFVGQVATDGSGLLVHSDLVEGDPDSYAVGHIAETWRHLAQIEPDIFSEFGLQALETFVQGNVIPLRKSSS